jgi:hypothetical protein
MLHHTLEMAEIQLAELRRNAARHRLVLEGKQRRKQAGLSTYRFAAVGEAIANLFGLRQIIGSRLTRATC